MSTCGETQVRERNRKTPEAETWMMSWKVQWRRCSAGEGRGWLIWLDTGVWRENQAGEEHKRPAWNTRWNQDQVRPHQVVCRGDVWYRLKKSILPSSSSQLLSLRTLVLALQDSGGHNAERHYNNLYWVYSSKWTLFCRLWRLTMTEMQKQVQVLILNQSVGQMTTFRQLCSLAG